MLEKPHRLSCPFAFEHEGRIFMVPESGANRSVDRGPLFETDGSLYRPARDRVGGYGVGVGLTEVTELTTERYSRSDVSGCGT